MYVRLALALMVMAQWPVAAGAGFGLPINARVQDEGGMCWVPDVEFPVPCDEGDDD